jgi:hypothetical protein
MAGEPRDATLPAVSSAWHQSLASAASVSGIYNIALGRSRARVGRGVNPRGGVWGGHRVAAEAPRALLPAF